MDSLRRILIPKETRVLHENIVLAGKISRVCAIALATTTIALIFLSNTITLSGILGATIKGMLAYDLYLFSEAANNTKTTDLFSIKIGNEYFLEISKKLTENTTLLCFLPELVFPVSANRS